MCLWNAKSCFRVLGIMNPFAALSARMLAYAPLMERSKSAKTAPLPGDWEHPNKQFEQSWQSENGQLCVPLCPACHY